MSNGGAGGGGAPPRSDLDEVAGLGRDELIRLVADLRSTVARQERTIAEQRAAISALQARPAPFPTIGERSEAAPPARPPAPLEPGYDFSIIFDGGAIGNPGLGYGSYQIVGADGLVAGERLEYGDGVTNNQAEYRTLIRALADLRDRLGAATPRTTVAVRGDSQLVVNTVTGRWRVKHPNLVPLHQEAVSLLRAFRRVDVAWHRRGASVRVLGH